MTGPRLSIIPAAAVTDRRLEGRDLQVLGLFGRNTDENGWCFRSQVTMAKDIGCGRATIQRSIARLVETGYLVHRAIKRPDGGDCSHHYRVILDQPDQPVEAGPNPPGGVPTGGQGVPAQDGQGVPAQDGQGVPTHERAPIRTTPDNDPTKNDSEREGAPRDFDSDPEIADAELFERFKRWPTFAVDSRKRTLRAWVEMSQHERAEAERSIEAYLEFAKAKKRSATCAAFTYLTERRWEALPRDRRARPVRTAVTRLGREFLALALKLIDEGRPLDPLNEALRKPGEPFSWPVDDMPSAQAIAAHSERIRADTDEGFAWIAWLGERGLDLQMALGPGLRGAEARWLWLPARWPPGWDADRAAREREAAKAEPKLSPDTLERMRALGVEAGRLEWDPK